MDQLFKGKKGVLFAVPGALTPGCSKTHLPGFVQQAEELRTKGVQEIACIAVNDAFVMAAWGKEHGVEGKKHRDIVDEPMGEKNVMSLPGIGEAHGKRLEDKRFDKAYKVLGQFLVLGKDEKRFKKWLKDTCGANIKEQDDCYGCCREWCQNFAVDLLLDKDPVVQALGNKRSQRYVMLVEDGVVKKVNVEPDGTGLTCSLAPNILSEL
ncbi:Barrier-to-autointegration factor [Merluccius polli]|uniref:Peroxiredoxin-5 n=1 Tax=Merluccius polli TaxID=89951 RepID=A0AA47NAF8_MERPO|nr:Barrier-to-autointegration factor [Merluccius polli]